MKYLIRSLLLFFSLFCGKAASSQQITVQGRVSLDSGWVRVAYFSRIPDFNKMYLASEDIFIGESSLDSDGRFVFRYKPEQAEGLYRIHFIKKNSPKLSIIIGGADENHGFFAADTGATIMIKNGTSGQRFEAVDVENAGLNAMFRTISNRDINDGEKNVRLLLLADSAKRPVLALLSLYETFNLTGPQLERANSIAELFSHSHYARQVLTNNAFRWQPFAILLVLSIVLFVLTVRGIRLRRKYKSRKFRNALSQREWEIVRLMLENKTNKEVAEILNIEVSTVKTHVNNIFGKVGVKSRSELQKLRDVILA